MCLMSTVIVLPAIYIYSKILHFSPARSSRATNTSILNVSFFVMFSILTLAAEID